MESGAERSDADKSDMLLYLLIVSKDASFSFRIYNNKKDNNNYK